MKRIISLLLTLMLLLNVVAISTTAAQVGEADNSAEAIADVAAVGSAETGAANVLNFDTSTSGWNNYKKVFCHVWIYGGESFASWQSKAEACTDKDGDGIWTYDLDTKGISLEAGTLYGVIFSNENGMQTFPLLFDTNVLGDTAYCDGTMYENPQDSSKTAQAAFWRGQDAEQYGPELCITSIGNVVGICMPYTTSKMAMFEDFLKNKLEMARLYAEKDDQQLLDDTAAAIGLNQDDIETAIANTGVSVEWDSSYKEVEDDYPVEEDSPAMTPSVPDEPYDYYDTDITLISLTATSGKAKLKWYCCDGYFWDGYYIYRKTDSSSWKKIKTITNNETKSYTDKINNSCATYYYRIKGYAYWDNNSIITGGYSNTLKTTFVPKPTLSSVTSTSSGLKVSWKKVSNATGYEVYRKASNENSYKKIATVKGASNTSYNDKTVKNGITYRYALKAYKSKVKSAYSSTKAFDPKAKSEMRLAKKGTRTLSLAAIKSKKYYYSSNKKIFTVNSKGKITAKAGGKATLTVKAKGVCVKTTILVSSPKVSLTASKTKIYRGTSTTFKAVAYPDNAKITWKTSNSKIATVSSSGKVIGKGKGTATITASIKYNGKTYKKSVKITVVCQKPSFHSIMPNEMVYTQYIAIKIKNNGSKALRIYSSGAKCAGKDMVMCGVENGKYVDYIYSEVNPGKEYTIMFRTKNNKDILYTDSTSLYFKYYYDGLFYTTSRSSKSK